METHTQNGTMIKWRPSAYTSLSWAANKREINRASKIDAYFHFICRITSIHCLDCVRKALVLLGHQSALSVCTSRNDWREKVTLLYIWKEKKVEANLLHCTLAAFQSYDTSEVEKIHLIVNFFWHSFVCFFSSSSK